MPLLLIGKLANEVSRRGSFYHITQSDEKNFVSVHKSKSPLCYTASSIVKGALSHGTDQHPQQPSRKKAILSLLVLLALTCVVVFIFSSHWAEISTALAQLSFWQVLLVLAIGLTYPLLEGIVCWLIIRCRLPGFTLRRGLMPPLWASLATRVGLGAGLCPWSPTISITAACRWAPVWA